MSRRQKWPLLIVALLTIAGIGFVQYGRLVGNPKVIEEITNNPDGERAAIVMLLTLPDDRSLPVNYLREGDQVFVGVDGPWWRQFRGPGVPVTMLIRGERLHGLAEVKLDDAAYVADIFSRLRPSAPTWLPTWLNGRLLVITLNHQTKE
ncbi:MAG: hypothetical protein AB8B93_19255 [Pseudomonadales bacterium]